MKASTRDMLRWEEFLTVSLDFFLSLISFFKIRISLLHRVAIHIKFCPAPWSPLSRATVPLSQAQCSAGWENREQETFPCYSQSRDNKLMWECQVP